MIQPHARSGSIIVVVLVVMTFLAGTIITTLIATQKLCSLAQSRCVYQQRRALLDGLLEVGIAYCCDHRTTLFSSKDEHKVTLSFDPWPCAELVAKVGRFKGAVTIRAQGKGATIDAHLSADKQSKSGSCTVSLWDDKTAAIKDSKLKVSNWLVDA